MGRSKDTTASSLSRPSTQDLQIIILGDAVESAHRTNECASKLGSELKSKLKTAQIRNIFGKVRQIEMAWLDAEDEPSSRRELVLLIPKMRYQTERKPELESLAEVLIECINLVEKGQSALPARERFQRFVDFFEAILAYHKAAGGN
ncbi:MAG: type III-A CRISPR-associated protein Csm2 [Phototrophicaceae bacterium]